MALIHLEGFEGIRPAFISRGTNPGATDCVEYLHSQYSGRISPIGTNSFHIRRSQDGRGGCLGTGISTFSEFMWVGKHFTPFTATDEIIIGLRVKFSATSKVFEIMRIIGNTDSTLPEARLATTINNALELQWGDSATVVATSANDVFDDNTWHYIEWKTVLNSTSGLYEVKVDGVQVLSGTAQTASTASVQAAGVHLLSPAATVDSYAEMVLYDDWYICNDTGTINNDFLGDIHIHEAVLGGAGNETDFSTFGGSLGFANLNQKPSTDIGDTSGVKAVNTSALKSNFTVEPFEGTGGSIVGVTLDTRAKTESGYRAIGLTHVINSGASSSSTALPNILDNTEWTGGVSVYQVDPDTGVVWTESGLNSSYFGMEIT